MQTGYYSCSSRVWQHYWPLKNLPGQENLCRREGRKMRQGWTVPWKKINNLVAVTHKLRAVQESPVAHSPQRGVCGILREPCPVTPHSPSVPHVQDADGWVAPWSTAEVTDVAHGPWHSLATTECANNRTLHKTLREALLPINWTELLPIQSIQQIWCIAGDRSHFTIQLPPKQPKCTNLTLRESVHYISCNGPHNVNVLWINIGLLKEDNL